MKYSFIQSNDLPDEILMIILRKLHSDEVLYSLISLIAADRQQLTVNEVKQFSSAKQLHTD